MLFIESLMLWFLGACAIPPIIHLINRMRYQTIPWSAIIFVAKAHRASTRMARIKELLILLFRILAIASLAIAFARPFFSNIASFSFLSPSAHPIIILDRSASMSEKETGSSISLIEKAISSLEESLTKLEVKAPFTLIDGSSFEIKEVKSLDFFRSSKFSLVSDTKSQIPDLLHKAYEYIYANKISSFQVWILSDCQSSDWNIESPLWQELDAKFADKRISASFFLINPRQDKIPENLSLKLESFHRDISNPKQFEIFVKIESNSKKNENIPLSIETESGRSSMNLSMFTNTRYLEFYASTPSDKNFGWTKLELPDDDIPFDNRLFFAYGDPGFISCGLRCKDPYIEKAFSAAILAEKDKKSNFTLTTVKDPVLNRDILKNFDILILDGMPEDIESFSTIDEFLRGGKNIFIFPSEEITKDKIKLPGGLTFSTTKETKNPENISASSFISPSSPLPDEISDALAFAKFAKRVELEGEFNSLLKFEDGKSLLAESFVGNGAVYAFCADLSKNNTDFISNPAFPILLRRLVLDISDKKGNFKNIHAKIASGEDVGESERIDAKILSTHFLSSGIYQCNGRLIAVNPQISEYEREYLPPDTLRNLLSGKISAPNVEKKSNLKELWRELLLLALIFLIAEQFLCQSFNVFMEKIKR